MKTIQKFLLLSLILLLSNSLFAQKEVKFEIRHWLGNVPFALNTPAQNNLGHEFNVSRLEYYLSEISIVHDSGVVTRVPDTSFLIDPTEPMMVDLGSYAIDQVEGIHFHIGVDPARNHNDPGLLPVTHPLGPKAPSMHWGWAAGYRFIAMEGKSGNGLAYDYQLHGLGDVNYFKTEVENPMLTPFRDGVVISLDADYAKVLHNIFLNSGVIEHGENKEAKTSLINMRSYVFSPASPTTSIDHQIQTQLRIYPNPSPNGQVRLLLDQVAQENYQIMVTDMLGRQLIQTKLRAGQREASLEISQAGVYAVTLFQNGKKVITKKLVVNQ